MSRANPLSDTQDIWGDYSMDDFKYRKDCPCGLLSEEYLKYIDIDESGKCTHEDMQIKPCGCYDNDNNLPF